MAVENESKSGCEVGGVEENQEKRVKWWAVERKDWRLLLASE